VPAALKAVARRSPIPVELDVRRLSHGKEHTPVHIHVLMKIRKLRVFSLVDPANSGFSLSRNLSSTVPGPGRKSHERHIIIVSPTSTQPSRPRRRCRAAPSARSGSACPSRSTPASTSWSSSPNRPANAPAAKKSSPSASWAHPATPTSSSAASASTAAPQQTASTPAAPSSSTRSSSNPPDPAPDADNGASTHRQPDARHHHRSKDAAARPSIRAAGTAPRPTSSFRQVATTESLKRRVSQTAFRSAAGRPRAGDPYHLGAG
jgi:hypothetical protein